MMENQKTCRIRPLAFTAISLTVLGVSSSARAQTSSTPALEPAATDSASLPANSEIKPSASKPESAATPALEPPKAPPPENATNATVSLDTAGKTTATTAVAATTAPGTTEATEPDSWFYRPPLSVSVGKGEKKLSLTLYGFLELDAMVDSTRSYGDAIGSSLVLHGNTYAGKHGRTQFSSRNTRLGLLFESPELAGVKPTAVFEADFFGNQPNDPHPVTPTNALVANQNVSETSYYSSPTFRLRQAYVKLKNDYVDVLAGQTYDVFGWQNYFFPCSVQFLGLPNQVFSRSAQLRLSHHFGIEGPVGVEVAFAALRPAQRDSEVPDLNGGLRLAVNGWKGITTPGNYGTTALPLSVGVSGTVRQFKLNAFTPPPTQRANGVMGWGLSVDALIPVIPAKNADDRGNKLSVLGSFVMGTGIGDLITAGGGAEFPTLPNPTQSNPAPYYSPNVDNGLVTFDTRGVAHTIDWQAFRAGLQYYLPPSGRVIFSANFTQAYSKNMSDLFPKGGAEVGLLVKVADASRYVDANLFWDATATVRFGISGQYSKVEYLDGNKPHNLRAMAQALYAF